MKENLITYSGMFTKLATFITESKNPPFDFAVVDEAQDMSVAHLRFLAALGGNRPNSLFFTGDLGQRIFQQPFSWKALGVDIRGRAQTLNVNYRTSHQIRMQADRLLSPEVTDADGNREERGNTVSVFNGSLPTIKVCDTLENEKKTVSEWILKLKDEGLRPDELGVFVRSGGEIDRAVVAVKDAGLAFKILDEKVETTGGFVSISTMHLAKGLEFRAVVVMACDDEIIPLQSRIETIADDADLEDVYNTERHLLYVACTRARDYLLITSVAPASEFLDDLKIQNEEMNK
jgi:superfamily I DNA/RNA helicase